MKENIIDKDKSNFILMMSGLVFCFLMILYFVYSIGKFNMLSNKSLVQGNVVMQIIQHHVNCVCPKCGYKGIPMCPKCNVEMYWNGYNGTFICSSCGGGGFPTCPKCGSLMTWIENR